MGRDDRAARALARRHGVVTLVRFFIVLGILIFVHELGHFVVAKLAGIRVEEFGFGFPPRLFTLWRRGDTEYTINALPLGGFVRMMGEEDPTDPRSFARKSRKVRALVLLAGSGMNVLLAIVLFTVALSVFGDPVPQGVVRVTGVEPGSPAAIAGLQVGDVIHEVAGTRILNNGQVVATTQEHLGEEITIAVHRGLDEIELKIRPRKNPPAGQGAMGVRIEERIVRYESTRYSPWEALVRSTKNTMTIAGTMVFGLPDVVRSLAKGFGGGDSTDVGVAGPIGIAQMTNEVADWGMVYLLEFMAFLSINLAVINMLPIPALDGGRLLFVLIEGVRGGRRVDPQKEGYVHLVGMVVLITLMVVIAYFDLQRVFSGAGFLR